ncbi:MAG: protein phosphatase 2C domain-containing protein [Planctomycetota bacterium]|nr:protein phosphatase 2C domain-containing protein [Planctomycetota bacterium]
MRRQNNQDSCIVQMSSDEAIWKKRGHLFVVADGMGGHAVGELASKIATDTLPHTFFKNDTDPIAVALKDAVEKSNAAIYERGSQNRDFERMGTTCSSLVLSPEGAFCGHVGDSRVYRVRAGKIEQLTFDHSLQWELIRRGRMKPEEVFQNHPRNVITRSLGPEAEVNVDIEGPFEVLPGDVYVLCSDGLTGHLQNHEIGAIARELSAKDACRLLGNLANLRGGSDNTTVVIAKVGAQRGFEMPVEPQEPEEGGISWRTLAAMWVIASAAVGGSSMWLLGQRNEGMTLIGLALTALLGLGILWLKKRRENQLLLEEGPTVQTKVWKPYQTASAKFTRKFLDQLVSLESELHRMAMEEGWGIDYEKLAKTEENAKQSMADKQYTQALLLYSKMIDLFMTEIVQRKQRAKEGKA